MVSAAVGLLFLVGFADALHAILSNDRPKKQAHQKASNLQIKPKKQINLKGMKTANIDVMHLDGKSHRFGIERDSFVWDGKPVVLQAGEMHYFRIPSAYWKDRILRAKAMGMNAIQTYVPWNFHETDEGVFDFKSEMHDVVKFLEIAKEVDMPVVLRPGPYICAEWTGGGLPGWLQSKPGLKLRTYEHQYIDSVNRWFARLLPKMKPLMAENGGPIIMVQIENEYGVLGDTINNKEDKKYMEYLRDTTWRHLGNQTLLFTDDPAFGAYPLNNAMFMRGGIPGTYRAINMGPESINDDTVWAAALALHKKMNGKGRAPFFVAETYSGWFTKWEEPRVTRKKTYDLQKAMLRVKNGRGSLGLYMVHGGTNFGFWAGANDGSFLTSYDYNAPINEAGGHGMGIDNRDKFEGLKEVFAAGRNITQEPPLPVFQKLDSVEVQHAGTLHQEMDDLCHKGWRQTNGGPKSAEAYGYFLGMMAYRYESNAADMSNKRVEGKASDPSHLWVNGKYQSYVEGKKNVAVSFAKNVAAVEKGNARSTVTIVVDSHGRANFGMEKKQMHDPRGLWEAKVNGKYLGSGPDGQWSVCNLRLTDPKALAKVAAKSSKKTADSGPAFFSAKLEVLDATKDTFLHPGEGWEKGVAFINGFNLGRYNMNSPQKDLYVPASVLKEGANEILILETGEKALQRDKMGPLDFLATRITRT